MNPYRGRGRGRYDPYSRRGNNGIPHPPMQLPPMRGRGFPPGPPFPGPFPRPPFPGMPPMPTAPPPPIHLPPPPPNPMSHPYAAPQVQMQRPPFPPTTFPPSAAIPSVSATPVAPAASRPQQTVGDWIIHTPQTGPTYYYNTITKRSQYELPEALQKPAAWKEYKDNATGKTYYSNGITTTWERPVDYVPPPSTLEATNESSSSSSEPPARKKLKVEEEIPKLNRSEATERFKSLLEKHQIAPNLKFTDVQKVLQDNVIWKACENVLTNGNRKQLLAEYQTKRSNELKKQSREQALAARAQFIAALHDQAVPIDANWELLEPTILERLKTKDNAIPSAEQRSSLYLEYCEDVRKRNDRKKRNEKRVAMERYREYLDSQRDSGALNSASKFPTTPLDATLTDSERRGIFAEYLRALHTKELNDMEANARKTQEQHAASRSKLIAALKALATEGQIVPATPWESAKPLLSDDVVREVAAIDNSLPMSIFREFSSQWSDTYRRHRAILSRVLPNELERSMEFDDFAKQLKDEANAKNISIDRILEESDSANLYFRELTGRLNVRGISKRQVDSSSEDEGEVIDDDDDDEND